MTVGKFFGTIGKVGVGIYMLLLIREGFDRHLQNKRVVVSQRMADEEVLSSAALRQKLSDDFLPIAQSGAPIKTARQPGWPAVQPSDLDRAKVAVSFASLDGLEQDHAGSWGAFRPGPGRINSDPNDWHVVLNLTVYQPVELKGITVLNQYAIQNGYPAEGWSTTSEKYYDKGLYPVVVFKDGEQVNSAADQSIGILAPGNYKFDLFMQKESPKFGVAIVKIILGDGTFFQSPVFAQIPEHSSSIIRR